jgi:hypothetical protein
MTQHVAADLHLRMHLDHGHGHVYARQLWVVIGARRQ